MDAYAKRIFKNKIFEPKKLIKFGFKFDGIFYTYSQKILDNQFELFIFIKNEKDIETKLTDCASGELYTLHLFEDAEGTFVGKVREVYEDLLNSIAQKCCNNTYFIYPQSNRIVELIKNEYNDVPEFLWEKAPGYGVFRNPESQKWYAVILNIDKSKLDKSQKGEVEILDIKLDYVEIQQLLKTKGFFPAYHMNKKSWITILLDDTIKDEKIMDLIQKSHKFSQKKQR